MRQRLKSVSHFEDKNKKMAGTELFFDFSIKMTSQKVVKFVQSKRQTKEI